MEVHGKFHDEIFQPRYQRNNKRGGLKNLRCFPTCGFRHKERGFCGRSVLVDIAHPRGVVVLCWVEFRRCSINSRFKVGEVVSKADVELIERTKDDPTKELVRGERLAEKSGDCLSVFEFNKERRGWHYGWASNKHTCNSEHCLQCYVLEATQDQQSYKCRDVFSSPKFMLFCRRRRRFTMAPSAPLAEPAKRKIKVESDDEDNSKIRRLNHENGKTRGHRNDSSLKLDSIMRRLGAAMSRLQQTKKTESNAIKLEDDLSFTDAIDLFTSLADLPSDDTHLLPPDLPPLDLPSIEPTPVPFPSNTTQDKVEKDTSELMVEDVAQYLLGDRSFKKAMDDLVVDNRTGVDGYSRFLRKAQEHLEAYRRSRNISIAEFDSVFATSAKEEAQKRQDDGDYNFVFSRPYSIVGSAFDAFASLVSSNTTQHTSTNSSSSSDYTSQHNTSRYQQNTIQHSTMPHDTMLDNTMQQDLMELRVPDKKPLFFYAAGSIRVPNISGQWRRTPESEVLMQEMRTKCGTPWVLSKMFEFMESRFEIEQSGLQLTCRFKRTLIKNSTLCFVLDGEQHEWGIKLPPPFHQLHQGWTYRAWVDDNKVVLTHTIGDQRLIRVNWVNESRSVLYSTVILEARDSTNTTQFIETARCNQEAVAEAIVAQT